MRRPACLGGGCAVAQIIGKIPVGLQGRLLRNGPNPQIVPKPHEYHWFDGDGMVHAVRFGPRGDVGYSSQYVRTTGWREEHFLRRILFRGLGQPTGLEHLRVMAMNMLRLRNRDTPLWNGCKNTANNNLVVHGGRLLALWEAGYPYELDPALLSTKGVQLFGGALESSFTAHPKTDATTGELMYYGYNLTHQAGSLCCCSLLHCGTSLLCPPFPSPFPCATFSLLIPLSSSVAFPNSPSPSGCCPLLLLRAVCSGSWHPSSIPAVQPHLQYGVVGRDGAIVHKADIRLPHPVMMHDFGITERHTLFLDFPIRFQMDKILETRGQCKAFFYDENKVPRIGLMPRHGTEADLQWFEVGKGFVMHVLNAYEEEDAVLGGTTVVLRGFRFDAFSALGMVELAPHLQPHEVCRLHEWRLHLPSGTSTERCLSPLCSDFPALNPAYVGRKNRYGYSARYAAQPGPGNAMPVFNGLLKHDLELGTMEEHNFGAGRYSGEPIFVPRPQLTMSAAAAAEDDGWLLVHVHDESAGSHGSSEVLVLDAGAGFKGPPLARIIMPRRVPYGFHGIFAAASTSD
eukprot:SM000120S25682  [mRNA]  locus=s120:12492:16396:- [translate_table: standard]